jgi:hypothetical protein
LTADGQLWSWGTIIGLPPQQPTGLGPVVERTLSRVFKRPYGGGMSYPSTRDPWLIMRFETNAPATMSEGK